MKGDFAGALFCNRGFPGANSCWAVWIALFLLPGPCVAVRAASGVIAWGLNDRGQCNIPNGLTNVIAVSAGQNHAVALLSDGTVRAWGDNTYNELNVPVRATNIMAVSAGGGFTLALRANGTVIGWGLNSNGQTNIPAGLTNVIAISAGSSHCLALRQNGTVVGWGDNYYGAASVPSGLNNVVEVGAGGGHSLARRADGSIYPWGDLYGLYYLPPEATNTISSSAGGAINAIARADGSVFAWGDYSAQFVPAEATNVNRVSAGYLHVLALKNDGTLAAWGWDGFSGATHVPYGLTNVQGASAGYYFNLAINDGAPVLNSTPLSQSIFSGVPVTFTVAALGLPPISYQWQHEGSDIPGETNASLVLTNPQTADAGNYTVVVSNPNGSVTSPAATLAVTNSAPIFYSFSGGQIVPPGWQASFSSWVVGSYPINYQWRLNGVAIPGATGSSLSLTNIQLKDSGSYELVASNPFGQTVSTNAVLSVVSHYLATWGDGTSGQTNASPVARSNAIAIAAGISHSVVLLADGSLAAFGLGSATNFPPYSNNLFSVAAGGYSSLAAGVDGSLVSSLNQTSTTPAALPGVRAIALGYSHGLGLLSSGVVVGWGDNHYGQTNVPAGLTNAISVCAGDYHSLALRRDGTVAAWGTAVLNDHTQFIPYAVPANLSNVVALAAGAASTLALRSDGTVVTWTPQQTNVAPVLQEIAPLSNAVAIAYGGGGFILALRRDGLVKVYGAVPGVTNLPIGLSHVTRIAAGYQHSLAIMDWAGPVSPRAEMTQGPSTAVLSFPSTSGRTYTAEYTDSLSAPNWQRVALLAGTGDTVRLTNSILSSPQRFYRICEW